VESIVQLRKKVTTVVAAFSQGGRTSAPHSMMDYYQHDFGTTFRFQLAGELTGADVMELEHAWHTATSIMRDKQLILDVSGLTGVDEPGVQLIQRMFGSGALVVSSEQPASRGLLLALGVPVSVSVHPRRSRSLRSLVLGILSGF
jgi:hypothetical protein